MRQKKYDFHPDLKKYEKVKPPVVRFMLRPLQKLMGTLYGIEKSDAELTVETIHISAADGYAIRVLVYTPLNVKENGPALIFYHGGGFVFQAAPHHFALTRRLTKALGIKSFFVDYRMSPKYTFPTAPEDAFAVYDYIQKNGRQLGIDPKRIALCGDSAGGNLAAVASMMARDRGIQLPQAQMLLYPFIDRNMQSETMLRFTDTPMCNSAVGERFNSLYFPFEKHEMAVYYSPVEATTLEGLPQAYIETAEYDCLRSGGELYARRLKEAGVPLQYHEVKAAMHGYDIAKDSSLVAELMEKRVAYLKEALGI